MGFGSVGCVVASCALLLGLGCARSHTRTELAANDHAPPARPDQPNANPTAHGDEPTPAGEAPAAGEAPRDDKPPTKDAAVAGDRPRLVVSVVINQLGSDTLLRLEPLLADDGALAHARAEGVVYEQVVYPYAATLTAPGHAAIYSGAAPAESGVTANYRIDQTTRDKHAAEDDGTHAVIGSGGFAGPGILHVDTVSDALKAATHDQGRVVSISLKPRSAVLPGGRHPDIALWYNAGVRGFTTSTYYADERPAWVVAFERAHPINAENVIWSAHDPDLFLKRIGPDDAAGEGDQAHLGIVFPHRLADADEPYDVWSFVPASAEYMLELALEAVDKLELGADDVPDLLALSISSTDYTGHIFGPNSWEYADHLWRVDRALMRMIDKLSAQTTVAVLITSDHGVAQLPEHSHAEQPAAVRLNGGTLATAVEQAIEAEFGGSGWVVGYDVPYMLLSKAAHDHPQYARMRSIARKTLRAQAGVKDAYDVADVAKLKKSKRAIDKAVALSIHPDSSGDLYVVMTPYVVPDIGLPPGAGTTHGSPWEYDSHVPVLLWGPGIAKARHGEDLDQRRVAPTLSALLRVPPPTHALQPALPGSAPWQPALPSSAP